MQQTEQQPMEQPTPVVTQGRVFEVQSDILLGDVFESIKYPNFTQIDKGVKVVVCNRTNGAAMVRAMLPDGTISPAVQQLKIQWLVNGYLTHVGVDDSILNHEYVRRMCSTMGVIYVEVPEELKQQWYKLPTRGEINRAILEYKEATRGVENKHLHLVLESINEAMQEMVIESARTQLRSARSVVENKQRDLDNAIATYTAKLRELEAKSTGANMAAVESLSTILNAGWYKYHSVNNTVVSFITPEVVITYSGTSLNFGQYKIYLDFTNFQVKVLKFINNIEVDGYIHPHVDRSGSVCWGNASDARFKAESSLDFNKLLTLLREVLSNYNPVSPYMRFEVFNTRSMDGNRVSELARTPYYSHWDTTWIYAEEIDLDGALIKGLPYLKFEDSHGDERVAVHAEVFRRRFGSETLGYFIKIGADYYMIGRYVSAVDGEDLDRLCEHEDYDTEMTKFEAAAPEEELEWLS